MENYLTDIYTTKQRIVNRTIFTSVVLALIALIPSLARVTTIGWQLVMIVHICLALFLFFLFLVRHKLKFEIKTHLLLSLFFIVATVGSINFRIASSSFFILVVVTIGVLVLGKRTGIMYLVAFLLIVSSIGYLHISDKIFNNFDFNDYTKSYPSWVTFVAAYAFAGFVLIDALSLYYKYFKGNIKDIASKRDELSEAYKRLKETEDLYHSIYQGSNDGFIFIDKDFRINDYNESFAKMLGYNQEQLQSEYLSKILVNKSICKHYFYSLGNTVHWGESVETELRGIDGDSIPVEITSFSIADESILFWSVIKDLREKRELEEQIITSMIRAEEQERERYAKDLHDGLGPYLSTAMIYVNTIPDEYSRELISEYASKANEILLEATTTIREISNNLCPLVLTDFGIAQALRSFIEKTQNTSTINFKIDNNLNKRIAEVTEITAYRVLVELINNSIKYSKAKHISIDLNYSNPFLQVSYSDDGVGFDYQRMRNEKRGFGLINIENRIKKLNGDFIFATSQGKGVKVEFTI